MTRSEPRRTMNIERMQETIALLRSVPPEKFDYGTWGFTKAQAANSAIAKQMGHCGMVACAGGWMTTHKPFKKQGLMHGATNLEPVFKDEAGNNHYGERALAVFLGTTDLQAERAFIYLHGSTPGDVTAADVANYLEKLLNAKLRRDARKHFGLDKKVRS